MQTLPKVTIITPVLNSEGTIKECILSVAAQTYSNKEHLLIDGQSTDGTLEVIKKYAKKYSHIKLLSEKDTGIYDAMNKGIDMSEGWLYFLGGDDILYNDKILKKLFSDNPYGEYDVIYGNAKFKISGEIYDGKFNCYKLLKKNICHQAIFFKKRIFDKFGRFETKYKGVADWVLNMQWFNSKSIKYKYVNMVIAIYNEDGYCFNNPDKNFMQDYPNLIKNYFPAMPLFFLHKQNSKFIRFLINLLYGYQEKN
jgi:glycosyltransferase involved in cell wall biosynthesis